VPQSLPAVSIAIDDNTDSTKESDCEYASEHDADGGLCMEDDVDTVLGIDLDVNVDMEMHCDDEEEDNEERKDQEKDEEEEDEEEDENEDNGKEPQMIGQGEMEKTSSDDVDTMVDNQPTVLPEQGQEFREHTPYPQPPLSALRPATPDPRLRPRTWENHTLSRLECLGLVLLQKPGPAVPTLPEDEGAGKPMDINVNQQLVRISVGGISLPEVLSPISQSVRHAPTAK